MSQSLFLSLLHQIFTDDVDDATFSKLADRYIKDLRYNVLYSKKMSIIGDTAFELNDSYKDEDIIIIVRSKYAGYLEVVPKVPVTPPTLNARMYFYGNDKVPAIAIYHTKDVESLDAVFTYYPPVTSPANATAEIFIAVTCPDNDPRLEPLIPDEVLSPCSPIL